MQIITTIPDSSLPAWQSRVDQYNAGSGLPPVDIEGFAQVFRDEETARYVDAKADADKLAMASNECLMALGLAVAAQPDKLDAVEKAVKKVLS